MRKPKNREVDGDNNRAILLALKRLQQNLEKGHSLVDELTMAKHSGAALALTARGHLIAASDTLEGVRPLIRKQLARLTIFETHSRPASPEELDSAVDDCLFPPRVGVA